MDPQSVELIVSKLDELIKQVGAYGEMSWPILISAARLDGILNQLWWFAIIAIVLFGHFLWGLTYREHCKLWPEGEPGHEGKYSVDGGIFWFIASVAGAIILAIIPISDLKSLFIPEYYALKELMCLIK